MRSVMNESWVNHWMKVSISAWFGLIFYTRNHRHEWELEQRPWATIAKPGWAQCVRLMISKRVTLRPSIPSRILWPKRFELLKWMNFASGNCLFLGTFSTLAGVMVIAIHKDFVERNLKPGNTLFDENRCAKLIHFRSARSRHERRRLVDIRRTRHSRKRWKSSLKGTTPIRPVRYWVEP
jgi:hypothetical protein